MTEPTANPENKKGINEECQSPKSNQFDNLHDALHDLADQLGTKMIIAYKHSGDDQTAVSMTASDDQHASLRADIEKSVKMRQSIKHGGNHDANPQSVAVRDSAQEQAMFAKHLNEWFLRCQHDALHLIGYLCINWVQRMTEEENPDLQNPVKFVVHGQPFEMLVSRKPEEVKRVH